MVGPRTNADPKLIKMLELSIWEKPVFPTAATTGCNGPALESTYPTPLDLAGEYPGVAKRKRFRTPRAGQMDAAADDCRRHSASGATSPPNGLADRTPLQHSADGERLHAVDSAGFVVGAGMIIGRATPASAAVSPPDTVQGLKRPLPMQSTPAPLSSVDANLHPPPQPQMQAPALAHDREVHVHDVIKVATYDQSLGDAGGDFAANPAMPQDTDASTAVDPMSNVGAATVTPGALPKPAAPRADPEARELDFASVAVTTSVTVTKSGDTDGIGVKAATLEPPAPPTVAAPSPAVAAPAPAVPAKRRKTGRVVHVRLARLEGGCDAARLVESLATLTARSVPAVVV